MENNNLLVEKYNKINNLQSINDPKIFSRISLLKKVCQYPNVTEFEGYNKSGQDIRMYFSTRRVRQFDTNIIYLSSSPNVILIEGNPQNMIIETGVTKKLENWLYQNELDSRVPYISQMKARDLIIQLNESASNFKSRSLVYDCFSTRNVVFNSTNSKWQLSLAAYLFGIDKNNSEYFHESISVQRRMAFSMACLFFKLIYGFSPIPSNPSLFDGRLNQLEYLRSQQTSQNKILKTYYFCERDPLISKECKNLLASALNGGMFWENWFDHQYFKPEFQEIKQRQNSKLSVNQENVFLRMTNNVDPTKYSLIVAAINHRESHPYEMLNNKPVADEYQGQDDLTYLRDHPVYGNIDFSQFVQQQQLSQSDQNNSKIGKLAQGKYFYNVQFDPEDSYPCRQLIKIIYKQKQNKPQNFNNDQYERKIKLHGYPYALGFELLKVAQKQSIAMQNKIEQAFDLLMKLSSFNKFKEMAPLIANEPNFKNFQEIKPQLRSSLNQLYEHFLNEAMRKYNSKVENVRHDIIETRKKEGLQYYRLCLKLLEGSLLMRKKGKDLNLERIQTNSRKEIQTDITNLLETYFPQRPQIH